MIPFFNKYRRSEKEVIEHNGVFKERIGLFQAVALIVTFTLGAGIFTLPFVVSKVGLLVGLIYLVLLGILIMGLNLMLGQVADATGENMQLVGLAKKYLGKPGEIIMTILFYLMSFGILVIYLIGEGETLSALLPGGDFFWSLIFFFLASLLLLVGMKVIKVVDFILSLSILFVILLIIWTSVPHIDYANYVYNDFRNILLPFGVILFAYSSVTSIPEAHSLLKNKSKDFRKAIVISSLIVMAAYILFVVAVLGVTGTETSELSTIALGQKVGPFVFILGNLFAVLTMGTSFLMTGMALRDSMVWDYKISRGLSLFLTLAIPLFFFVIGVRGFIAAIDIVGGVVVSSQMLMVLLVYWKAKHLGHLNSNKYQLHHVLLLMIPLTLVLIFGAVYSTVKLFL